ncbi:hypothetical protein BGZ94_008656 [Podila epigama]|nr:hypothetical protein BGZ94_008656 [Podila epigama]
MESLKSTPATPNAGERDQAVEENVKALKSRVIKISKLREVFDKKDQELNEAKASLVKAQQEIESLKVQLLDTQKAVSTAQANASKPTESKETSSAPSSLNDPKQPSLELVEKLRTTLENQTKILVAKTADHERILEQLRLSQERQKQAEDLAQQLGQKIKSTEMFNRQLEETVKNNDSDKVEVANLRTQVNRLNSKLQAKQNEVTQLKGELMKIRAESLEQTARFADQRSAWEKEKEKLSGEIQKGLQEQIDELNHQLEDNRAEYHVESEMHKEEIKDLREEVKTLQEENRRIKETTTQLQAQNDASTKANSDLREELQHARAQLAAKPILNVTSNAPEVQKEVSKNSIELAIQSLEEMKTQFSMLQWIHGHKTNTAKVKALEEQVKTLTKEKQALVDALASRVVESRSLSWGVSSGSPSSTVVTAVSGPQPTVSDTIPSVNTSLRPTAPTTTAPMPTAPTPTTPTKVAPAATAPTKTPRGRKRKAVVDTENLTSPSHAAVEAPVGLAQSSSDNIADNATSPISPTPKRMAMQSHWEVEDFGEVTDFEASDNVMPVASVNPRVEQIPSVNTNKDTSTSGNTVPSVQTPAIAPVPPTPTSLSASKATKQTKTKATRASKGKPVPTSSFADIQVRNISVNPFIPEPSDSLNYFAYLMDSPMTQEKKLESKLESVGALFPQKLQVLFQAVEKKALSIIDSVTAFRDKHVLVKDTLKNYAVEGLDPILIPQSLSPGESNIVQFLVLLDRRLPQLEIMYEWFFYASKAILQRETLSSNKIAAASILVRITTAICRIKGDQSFLPVLCFDILRHYQDAKTCLALCEGVASIWPAVIASYQEDEDTPSVISPPRRVFISTFQAILATFQESLDGEQLTFGYMTFVKKCRWPQLDDAPFANELTEELVAMVVAPEFLEKSDKMPGLALNLLRALELLLIQTYDWIDVYNEFLKPHLLQMMMDREKFRFAIPLVASVTQGHQLTAATTTAASLSTGTTISGDEMIRQLLEQILASTAEVDHQCVSARALILLANHDKSKLQKAVGWYQSLEDKKHVPEDVVAVLKEVH